MKITKSLVLALACLLTAAALLACSQEPTNQPQDDDSAAPTQTTGATSTAPSATTPVTTPAVTDPHATEPAPDAPLDYGKLTPSQLYAALFSADGFTVSVQDGPTHTTCQKADDLLYTHRWNDQIALDEEIYTDLTQDGTALTSALASMGLQEDTYWMQDDSYTHFNEQQTNLTLNEDVMAAHNLELAMFTRNGTTYTYFVSDTDGESVKITVTFQMPEIERS